jgi:hypothetical protein
MNGKSNDATLYITNSSMYSFAVVAAAAAAAAAAATPFLLCL